MLDLNHSRQRQQRLLQVMQTRRLDAVVCGEPRHAYYFSAHRPFWLHEAGFVLFADGRSWLATANSPAKYAAADEIVAYEANWMGTQRQEQPAAVAELALKALAARGAKRIGIDASAVSSQVAMGFDGELVAIDPDLWQMRRRKDPDELELMKQAVRCCEAMYARAKEIIEPGVSELHVFGQLHEAAVKAAGEPMTALLGNDYACGVGGGAPRKDRVAKAGEIYVLDLGPTYRGYFSDNCRTFSVDRRPTDAQMKAWSAVAGALKIVESMAKPGVRGQDLFRAVDGHFKTTMGTKMPHHLGHGVGLQPHEFPHLNPKWDDVLLEGEVFTAEPAQYGPEIGTGIRLENIYVVTKTGVENLLRFPLELV